MQWYVPTSHTLSSTAGRVIRARIWDEKKRSVLSVHTCILRSTIRRDEESKSACWGVIVMEFFLVAAEVEGRWRCADDDRKAKRRFLNSKRRIAQRCVFEGKREV